MLTVGQRIKAIREQKGLTQKYVAKASGINVALLQKYEYGIRNPKDDQLKKLLKHLGWSRFLCVRLKLKTQLNCSMPCAKFQIALGLY